MKKLNRKGFTLVELLAVIIILAIVVGISIPAVLTTINKARSKAFQSSADAVADWIDRQYQAYLVADDTLATVDGQFDTDCASKTVSSNKITCSVTDALLTHAGVKPSNYVIASSSITINTQTGRSCAKLKGSSTGDYQSTATLSGGIC